MTGERESVCPVNLDWSLQVDLAPSGVSTARILVLPTGVRSTNRGSGDRSRILKTSVVAASSGCPRQMLGNPSSVFTFMEDLCNPSGEAKLADTVQEWLMAEVRHAGDLPTHTAAR